MINSVTFYKCRILRPSTKYNAYVTAKVKNLLLTQQPLNKKFVHTLKKLLYD